MRGKEDREERKIKEQGPGTCAFLNFSPVEEHLQFERRRACLMLAGLLSRTPPSIRQPAGIEGAEAAGFSSL